MKLNAPSANLLWQVDTLYSKALSIWYCYGNCITPETNNQVALDGSDQISCINAFLSSLHLFRTSRKQASQRNFWFFFIRALQTFIYFNFSLPSQRPKITSKMKLHVNVESLVRRDWNHWLSVFKTVPMKWEESEICLFLMTRFAQ